MPDNDARLAKKNWTFAQVPIDLLTDKDVSDGAKVLFAYLAWRQGTNAGAWPSVHTMAKDLGTSLATIRRRTSELEKAGYLSIENRPGHSNMYTINGGKEPPQPEPAKPEPANDTPVNTDTPCTDGSTKTDTPIKNDRATPIKNDRENDTHLNEKQGLEPEGSSRRTAAPTPATPKRSKANRELPPGLTVAAREFFTQFGRRRWATPGQREEFEATEREVSTAVMLRAVKWAAVKGKGDVGAICTCARKMAKEGNAKPRSRASPEPAGYEGIREFLAERGYDGHGP